MRKLMARVVLRSALAISAVGIVAAAGAFDGDTAPRSSHSAREAAGQAADLAVRPAAGSDPAATETASSYTLRTENGPRAALAARIVTATLLLTGLVLTGLGAIGTRGPALFHRGAPADDEPPPAYAYARHPDAHPRFGPPPT